MTFQARLGVLLALLFFGALFWAKGRDPFQRIWFTAKTANQGEAKCIAVLPKTAPRPLPVVIYLHGSGASLLGSGNDLRQMAEMGLAAVAIEYSQTNDTVCEAQLDAVLNYTQRQRWADTNAVAWVGYSLGAQRQLRFLLKHPHSQPELLVRLAGGWIPELAHFNVQSSPAEFSSILNSQLSTVLLIHGERDEAFPVSDLELIATVFRTNGMLVSTKILPAQSHALGANRSLIFRAIGEYCLTHLKGVDALDNYQSIVAWQTQAKPLWLFWLPALVWSAAWLYCRRVVRRSAFGQPHVLGSPGGATRNRPLTPWEIGLRWLAGILAALATGQTALHLIPSRLTISEQTLAIARKHLIQPSEADDFDFLSGNPVWQGKRLKTLLAHVELANYNRELVNWKLNDQVYRDFVLSPQIDPAWDGTMNWRRPLWESFYPRIRKEKNTETAAEIVVRHLCERVTVAGAKDLPDQIESIWLRQITNTNGFERIYVAVLRSTGIPSRLDARGQAEFWTETGWKPSPRPLLSLSP